MTPDLAAPLVILALDTTSRPGSVAVLRGDAVLAEIVGDAERTHGQRLPGDLMRALETAGIARDDIDLLAVAAGPGSFTGIRVGIAAIQGLAVATGRHVVPVSALDALAWAGSEAGTGRRIAAWMDAQRREVFAALYEASGRRVLGDATSRPAAATLDAWAAAGWLNDVRFIGDGATKYALEIRARVGDSAEIQDAPRLARIVGRMAVDRPDRAVKPHAILPIYIRRPDAELARSERGRRA